MRRLPVLLLGLLACVNAYANDLHPSFPLLDNTGQPVMLSGAPVSFALTCGDCHDVDFIVDSSDHSAAGVFDDAEPDCLTCHSDAGERRSWSAESSIPTVHWQQAH